TAKKSCPRSRESVKSRSKRNGSPNGGRRQPDRGFSDIAWQWRRRLAPRGSPGGFFACAFGRHKTSERTDELRQGEPAQRDTARETGGDRQRHGRLPRGGGNPRARSRQVLGHDLRR